jgi:Tol biopolymer transport system component
MGGESTDAAATHASESLATTRTEAPAGALAYQTYEGTLRLRRSDGSDDREIAGDVPGKHLQPDWSPDGKRLVFTSRTGVDTLFEADADGGNAHQLVECVSPCIGDESAAYSPDGRRLVFVRAIGPLQDGRPSDCGLWSFEFRTKTLTQLTRHPKCQDREAYPRWSPDGTSLVFFRDHYDDAGAVANAISPCRLTAESSVS